MRIGLPLLGVGLIVGFLFGIGFYTYRSNREGVLGLSENLLDGLRERVALQVAAYLEPASHAVLLGQSMLGRGGASEQAQVFASSVLNQTPQVANVLFANSAGDFMLVTRAAPGSEATTTKQIRMLPTGRTTTWTTRDASGAVTERHEDPADTYDARGRSWFIGARARDDVFWTTPYIFFTERAPGITGAVHGPGRDPDVIGVDIRLDALSNFLRSLSIGHSGRAYIVAARTGEMIAGPDATRLLQTVDGQLKPAKVQDVGDADLLSSWDHYRGEGLGTRVIDVDGRRLISIVTALDRKREASGGGNGQDWLLAIIVPEGDFSGFVKLNTQRAASLFLVVIGLAAGLGVLLVRQGLRSDHAERVMAERSEAARVQGEAFARLAVELNHSDPSGAPQPGFTETLARVTGASRVTLWQWGAGGQSLRCQDSFEPASGGHVAGLELSRQEIRALMETMAEGGELDVADAKHDRRTAALHALFMRQIGSQSVFIVAVQGADGYGVRGLVMLEDARRDTAAHDLVRAGATLLTLRAPASLVAAVAQPGSETAPTRIGASTPGRARRVEKLDGRQMNSALDDQERSVRELEQAIVLVLRLPGAALARGDGPDGSQLGHCIACAAQEIGARNGIPYLKMLGSTIVAAAGPAFDGDGATGDAALRMAQTTVELRDRCAALFDDAEGQEEFAFGLDAGRVRGGLVGPAPGLYNIWGEALDGARALAESAPDGSVQTSEAAYLLLRTRFLFRPRGLFHRPGLGDVRSYVLGGVA